MSFVMVDKICEIDPNSIKTKKLLSIAEPVYEIHFPFYPVLPAVLLLENVKQSIDLFLNKDKKEQHTLNFLKNVKKIKVYKSVFPGDVITTEIKLIQKKENEYIFDASIYNGSNVVAKFKEFAVAQVKE